MLGAPWSHPDYAGLVRIQRERGLRFALLVYDLIPILRPEWCDRGLVRLFRAWFRDVLPLCDVVLAISRATAADVEAYALRKWDCSAWPGHADPRRDRLQWSIATSCHVTPSRLAIRRPATLSSYPPLRLAKTIRCCSEYGVVCWMICRPSECRHLSLRDAIGWLVDDLMRQIANTDHLNGKLVVIENPTDADLATLYRGCLFTLLPSFHEGWGLPVTESLAFGKPCIISDRTSLPEAGGKFVRSFDPDNLHDAYHVIRQVIEDRPGLAEWEAEVRREFKPVPWSATVEAILAELGYPLEAPTMHVVQSAGESR